MFRSVFGWDLFGIRPGSGRDPSRIQLIVARSLGVGSGRLAVMVVVRVVVGVAFHLMLDRDVCKCYAGSDQGPMGIRSSS